MKIRIEKTGYTLQCEQGENLLEVLRRNGVGPDAPCGGLGTCGKCVVKIDGRPQKACETLVQRDCSVCLPDRDGIEILEQGVSADTLPDMEDRYAAAVDIGTTTVVVYLLDGRTGEVLDVQSALNPQTSFGADVVSRIRYVLDSGPDRPARMIRNAVEDLLFRCSQNAGIDISDITAVAVAGNTAMHHLFLGIDPISLTKPPYMPAVKEALQPDAKDYLPSVPNAKIRMLANIAGFIGADTVGCLTALRFDRFEKPVLMIDIGTNGEMVLGGKSGWLACSTAAGPAFEGARISMGMRGIPGAVDRVWLESGEIRWHVIGDGPAEGLCGSGLLDLTAVLLETGTITDTGRMPCGEYRLAGTEVVLTQKDVREVQLAKAAIRTGIELMAVKKGIPVADIQEVCLAGAFGNYMNPASACQIGMIPPELGDRIRGIGNAAGEGARLCALSRREYEYSSALAKKTEFLELASMPEFQDRYIDFLNFCEEDES